LTTKENRDEKSSTFAFSGNLTLASYPPKKAMLKLLGTSYNINPPADTEAVEQPPAYLRCVLCPRSHDGKSDRCARITALWELCAKTDCSLGLNELK